MKILSVNFLSHNKVNNNKNIAISNPYSINAISFGGLDKDTLSFSNKPKLLSAQEGKIYADKYKNSTSGYRGEFQKDFNDDFVYTMTHASGEYMIKHKNSTTPKTVVAGDTRQATKKYAPQITHTLTQKGIDVFSPRLDGVEGIAPVASPVLALITKEFDIPLGVLLTASHNPWKDGGYNFLIKEGMVAETVQSNEIAKNIVNITKNGKIPTHNLPKGKVYEFNPYDLYSQYIEDNEMIDFESIRKAGIDIFYEDFGGTGKYYFPKLMHDNGIEIQEVLSSKTNGPNPTKANLAHLSQAVVQSSNPLRIGLATDGDSDRFGAVDENGNYINSNDFLLLVAYHLIKHEGMTTGTIIKNHSTSEKLDALADYFNPQEGYDIEVSATPVGFKYLGGEMMRLEGTPKEAIIIGEESGGMTMRGHIPEKDGFLAIATLLELMAAENKPIGEILKDVNSLLGGDFVSECVNVSFPTEEEKMAVVDAFKDYPTGKKDSLFGYEIDKAKTLKHKKTIEKHKPNGDGHKIFLKNSSSVLIRKSGTEPILRYYIDSTSREVYEDLKDKLVDFALDMNGAIKA